MCGVWGVGEEIKKQGVGEVVSGFVAKNIRICIYTNLYFSAVELSKSYHNLRRRVR